MPHNHVVAENGNAPAVSMQDSVDNNKKKPSKETILKNITKRMKLPNTNKCKIIEISAPENDPCIGKKHREIHPLKRIANKGMERQIELKQSKTEIPPSRITTINSDSEDEDDVIIKSVVTIPPTSAINELVEEKNLAPAPVNTDTESICTTTEGIDDDSISKELTVSESEDEDAATLEKLISDTTPDMHPILPTPTPSTSFSDQKPENPPVEEYVPTHSKTLTFPKYKPSNSSRSSTPRRKIKDKPEARRYVPTNELLYDLNYIVNKINQNVGLAMYNAMVTEGLVKRYR